MHILHKKQPLSVITLISEKDCLTPDIRNPFRYLLITDKLLCSLSSQADIRNPLCYLLITDNLLCSLSVKILLLQVSGYIDSAGRCMGKRVCHTAAVSDNKETLVAGFQIFVDLNLHVLEFNLHAIKQSIVIRGSRCDLVQGIDHLDDAIQDTFRHNKA